MLPAYFRHPGSLRVLPGLCRKVSASPPRAPEAEDTFDVFSIEVPPKKITFLFTLTTIYKVSVQKVIFFGAKHNLKTSKVRAACGARGASGARPGGGRNFAAEAG